MERDIKSITVLRLLDKFQRKSENKNIKSIFPCKRSARKSLVQRANYRFSEMRVLKLKNYLALRKQ